MRMIIAYLFILAGILSGTYPKDPTELAGEWLYNAYVNVCVISLLMIFVGGGVIIYFLLKKKINQLNKIFISVYIIGSVLFILSFFFDPGGYLAWLVD